MEETMKFSQTTQSEVHTDSQGKYIELAHERIWLAKTLPEYHFIKNETNNPCALKLPAPESRIIKTTKGNKILIPDPTHWSGVVKAHFTETTSLSISLEETQLTSKPELGFLHKSYLLENHTMIIMIIFSCPVNQNLTISWTSGEQTGSAVVCENGKIINIEDDYELTLLIK